MIATDRQAMSEYYKQYIASMDGRPRYGAETCIKIDKFYDDTNDKVFDDMVDIATDFEESGFGAGFKFCLGLLNK